MNKDYFYKHHWTFLGILFLVYASIGFLFRECTWINAWLQTGAIAVTILFSVVLMIRTNRKNDEASQAKFQFYQNQNEKHLDTIKLSTEAQVLTIRETTKTQIESLQKLTSQQVLALKDSVKLQIEHQSTLSDKHLEKATNETERILKGFQESSDRQIESFIQNSQKIVDSLEDVVEHLQAISSDTKEMLENEKRLREIEEEKIELRNQQLNILIEKQSEATLKHKPQLQFYLDEHGIIFIDLRVVLSNTGGTASSMQFEIVFYGSNMNLESRSFSKTIANLNRNEQRSFDLTRAKRLRSYQQMEIRVTVWDAGQNAYSNHLLYERQNNVWFSIPLNEQRIIG